MQKRDLFWRHHDVLHRMAEYSSTPQGGTRVPLKYPKGTDQRKHMGDNAKWRSTVRFGLRESGRILLRRDPIFELVKHRRQRSPQTRIFSPQDDLVCRRRRCGKHEKWRGMRPSILTIHRTVTTRRADFSVRLIRRDRRAPLMMLVHEECRITCDHRHSLWYLTCSSDCGLGRNAIQQWSVHDFVPMTAAPGTRGKRKPSGAASPERYISTTRCHTAEYSPCIAPAQCALGCKPQMCERLL